MSTPDSTDYRPADQQERAENAHLNSNDPAKDAGKTQYGDFGKPTPTPTAEAPEGRSGSNDNPDEFSEFRNEDEAKAHPKNIADQPGHIVQNQDPRAVGASQNDDDTDDLRAAWAKDDPRYAGGGTHNAQDGTTPDDTAARKDAANK